MNSDREIVDLYVDDIIPNRFQPREIFDEKGLKELSASIVEHGVIQPIIVRKIGDKYEIIAGERRYKASVMGGLTKIPAIIRNLDDKESSKVALLENLQRRDLSAIEEARTYQKILDLDSLTQEELGATMGKSQAAVANKLRLLTLTDEVQEALLKDQISERHARSLLNIKDKEQQVAMLQKIITNRMTVRELEAEIKPSLEEPVIPEKAKEESSNFIDNFPVTEYEEIKLAPIVDLSASTPINIETLKSQTSDIQTATSEMPTADLDSLLKVEPQALPEKEEVKNYKFIPSFVEETESVTPEVSKHPDILDLEPAEKVPLESLIAPLGQISESPEADPYQNRKPIQINDDIELLDEEIAAPIQPQPYQPFANTESLLNEFRKNQPGVDSSSNEIIPETLITVDEKAEPANLKIAINTIRDMINSLESKGFVINLDEMDLENSYQINIKIDKN
ncbi:MAG: ParB/RepB/Spo0J family partition protein [Bacilli bacterium]